MMRVMGRGRSMDGRCDVDYAAKLATRMIFASVDPLLQHRMLGSSPSIWIPPASITRARALMSCSASQSINIGQRSSLCETRAKPSVVAFVLLMRPRQVCPNNRM
ncbi:hypothetical protein MRB53_041849 [Persea americana]|nr:hypothetical protein MRB53_041849 [Persea americana]